MIKYIIFILGTIIITNGCVYDAISVFVDDSLYFTYQNEGVGESKWPYNKPFYLILNVAVGGAWGGMQGINDDAFPQTMEVNYVRVYQKTE